MISVQVNMYETISHLMNNYRAILMKTAVPEKSDNMFTVNERKLAPEGLIQMFLEREENARRLETKTGKIIYFTGFLNDGNLISVIVKCKVSKTIDLLNFQTKSSMAKATKTNKVLV